MSTIETINDNSFQELSSNEIDQVSGGGKYRLGAAAGFAVGGVFGAALTIGAIAAVSYLVSE